MALGTITKPTPSPDFKTGNRRQTTRDVVLTSGANYVTGGSTIAPTDVGLRQRIESVYSTGQARTTSGGAATIPVSVDLATTPGSAKLQTYVAATGAEQSSNANLSTFSIRLTFVGI